MNVSEFDTLAQFINGLSQEELAQRLQVSVLKLQEMSQNSDFEQWSQQHDPEGVSWKIGQNRRYLVNLAFSKKS
ncbi:hypothetical protein [Spirulina sp. 06S082]|uniref:hypothetical protein n=1 Tax=Spirulina sp. 06S082 TaxID=3110248 RepID=UPI002B20DBD6|nr:hypothetical protein [Spirulina sp. 06S082]MEA5472405.1 hypothetical protein [Spirulina sp. 06S082]